MRVHNPRFGFTLLELLVSAVLTAILMAGLLAVLRSAFDTGRQSERLLATDTSTQWLKDQLERDLQNARGIQIGRDAFVLFGYLGQDKNGLPNYRPTYVGYRIGRTGLLRWHDDRNAGGVRAKESLVWSGAAGLSVAADPFNDDEPLGRSMLMEAGGLPLVPANISLRLTSASGQIITRLSVSCDEGLAE